MDMEIYEFEIAKNAEGGILATAGVKGADTSYRFAGPKALGGSSTIAKINISQRDLVVFILCYAPCAYAEIVAYSAAALSGATVQARHSDDIAVDRCAAAMKDKLASSRAKGRGGWDDPAQCSIASLSALLRVHVDKGDPLDVANIAMMIQQRGGIISAPVPPVAVPRVSTKLPKWIDDKKGSDPLVDDLIAYIEKIAAPQVVADEQGMQTIRERDCNADIADRLANGIAEHFGAVIGEHSSANCPWIQALDLLNTEPEFIDCAGSKRAALAAAPVQAQEPVACGCNGVGGCVTSVELPAGNFCKASCFSAAEQMAFRTPVQPVAVPDGWPTDEMVIRGAEQLQDCLRGAGVVHDFDADLKGTEIQQDIAESVFKSMLELAAPAAQGDATDGAYEFAAKVIELFDDATMRADHMLDAGECASVIRALKSTEIAAIAAKAAS